MRRIDRIYVSCCKRDFHLARICVASIRHWHPTVPISLLKDATIGDFDTSEIERLWDVSVVALSRKKFGWSFIKLEPFFLPAPHRFLNLDADIVFVGPVLDALEARAEDFVVQKTELPEAEIASHYYRPDDVRRELDAGFSYPGYIFNCGHVVGQTGMLARADFDDLVSWDGALPAVRRPRIFSHADQGVTNYVFHRMEKEGKISVGHCPFSIWSDSAEMDGLDLPAIRAKRASPGMLIHYAGKKPLRLGRMRRPDIVAFFEELYYTRVPGGRWKRFLRDRGRVAYFAALDSFKAGLPRPIVDRAKGWVG